MSNKIFCEKLLNIYWIWKKNIEIRLNQEENERNWEK